MKVQAQGDQLALSIDNGPLNASLNTVRIFNGENLVKETTVTGGLLVVQLENDAKWCNPFVGCKFEFWKRRQQVAERVTFAEVITLGLAGEKVVGDRIEVIPGGDPLLVDRFEELSLKAAGLGELVLDQVQTTMPPLTFAGLSHASRRSAIAEIEGENLVLTDFNPDGLSGVSVDLGQAGAWEGHTYLKPENKAMTLLSVLGEANDTRQLFSTLSMEGEDDTFALAATFGTPTYRMVVYDGEDVVHQELDLDNGQRGVQFSGNDPICEAIGVELSVALGICEYVWCFGQNAEGECFWEVQLPSGALFETPDGRVSGDRIVITENHAAHHRSEPAQMIFDEMRIQGAQVEAMTFLDEVVAPVKPPYSLFLPLLSR